MTASISFDLARSSTDPGWDLSLAHDALWRQFMRRLHYTAEGAAGLQSMAVAPGAGVTFDQALGDVAFQRIAFESGGAIGAARATTAPVVTLDWTAPDAATLRLDREWNSIKNIEVSSFTGTALRLENWVDVWVRLSDDVGRTIEIDGAKRAEVSLGGGDDRVVLGIDSKNAAWTDQFVVATGGGADEILVGASQRNYIGGDYDGRWTDVLLDGGEGDDVIRLDTAARVVVEGGEGRDTLVLAGPLSRYVIETIDGVTTVHDAGALVATLRGVERALFEVPGAPTEELVLIAPAAVIAGDTAGAVVEAGSIRVLVTDQADGTVYRGIDDQSRIFGEQDGFVFVKDAGGVRMLGAGFVGGFNQSGLVAINANIADEASSVTLIDVDDLPNAGTSFSLFSQAPLSDLTTWIFNTAAADVANDGTVLGQYRTFWPAQIIAPGGAPGGRDYSHYTAWERAADGSVTTFTVIDGEEFAPPYTTQDGTGFSPLNIHATYPKDANNNGVVVGNFEYLSEARENGPSFASHGFVRYADGGFEVINVPGTSGNQTYVTAVNDAGLVVGHYFADSQTFQGFIFDSVTKSYTLLENPYQPFGGEFGASGFVPTRIGEDGTVVGFDALFKTGLVVKNGAWGFLAEGTGGSSLFGINSQGQVVGNQNAGDISNEGAPRGVLADLIAPDAFASGTLTATVDGNAIAFRAATGAALYGDWSIDAAGAWSYQLDDADVAVEALRFGETLSDSFFVTATDGTAQAIEIFISGTDEYAQYESGVNVMIF